MSQATWNLTWNVITCPLLPRHLPCASLPLFAKSPCFLNQPCFLGVAYSPSRHRTWATGGGSECARVLAMVRSREIGVVCTRSALRMQRSNLRCLGSIGRRTVHLGVGTPGRRGKSARMSEPRQHCVLRCAFYRFAVVRPHSHRNKKKNKRRFLDPKPPPPFPEEKKANVQRAQAPWKAETQSGREGRGRLRPLGGETATEVAHHRAVPRGGRQRARPPGTCGTLTSRRNRSCN